MIDNFTLIKENLTPFVYRDEYYVISIVQKKKDGNDKDRVIKTILIREQNDLINAKKDIIIACNTFNARAYITLSPKGLKNTQDLLLMGIVKSNIDDIIISNLYSYVDDIIKNTKSITEKWIVDIENKDIEYQQKVLFTINDLFKEYCKKSNIVYRHNYVLHTIIPTIKGVHLIVRPFNDKEFSKIYPNINVYKNSIGTLLYFNNDKK